jgi:predicted acylesterase/phospholipase RssA
MATILQLLETTYTRSTGGFGVSSVFLPHGETLFRQDEPGACLYVVRNGRLRVIHNYGTSEERILRESGRGDCIGELALLSDEIRSATVVAVRDSELFQVSKRDFHVLIKEHPDAALNLLRVITGRLDKRDRREINAQRRLSVAVVPAEESVPIDWFCTTLRMCLPEDRRSLVLTSRHLPPEFAAADAESGNGCDAGVARWLNGKEEDSDFLILQGEVRLTAWGRRCVRQADIILLVGTTGAAEMPGDWEHELASLSENGVRPRLELVLIYEKFRCPHSGRSSPLPSVSRRHHVRIHSKVDLGRLARILIGQDVTLVLGAGGARAFAQIGVLRALEEVGIPVDRVGGTSMGAVVGGHYAMHQDWRRAISDFRRTFLERGNLNDFTLPLQSVLAGRRYDRMLEEMFGEMRIEDLPLSFFAMSCNLTRASAVVHRDGPARKWLGAGASVPGISPPLVHEGELYVDGAVLNSVPVNVAKQDGAGYVIAVDVSAKGDLRLDSAFQGRANGWKVLRSWLPWHSKLRRLPNMFEVLHRTTELSSVESRNLARTLADCYLELPVEHFKLLDWSQFDRLVELGYHSGLAELRGVRAEFPSVSSE